MVAYEIVMDVNTSSWQLESACLASLHSRVACVYSVSMRANGAGCMQPACDKWEFMQWGLYEKPE